MQASVRRGTRAVPAQLHPTLEVLETRELLSCVVDVRGARVSVTGDDGSNIVTIDDNGSRSTLVECDGAVRNVRRLKSVLVQAQDGDDRVQLSRRSLIGTNVRYGIDLGAGNDILDAVLAGVGSGRKAFLDFNVVAGAGSDNLNVSISGVIDGIAQLRLDGGIGDDRLTAHAHVSQFDDSPLGILDLGLLGGFDDDKLTLEEIDQAFGAATVRAFVDGGSGSDDCRRAGLVSERNCEEQFFDVEGNWEGTTSQGRIFTFDVIGSRITTAEFRAFLRGTRCSAEVHTTFLNQTIQVRDNAFEFVSRPTDGSSLIISGAFVTELVARGSLSIFDPYCNATAEVTWEATKQA